MKKLSLIIIICISIVRFSYGQHPEIPNREQLKQYNSYTHKIEPKSCWKYVYELKNGLIVKQENYCKRELMNRVEFEYDRFGNVERETNTFNINEGQINDISNLKLEYKDSLLIRKKFNYRMTEKYSDFNEFGKPKLIERIQESDVKIWPFKELIEYDNNGNIIKKTKFNFDLNNQEKIEKSITFFKYDNRNNVIEIHREYEPKQKFPIIMVGGPAKYEFEYYRYKYNKNGLWIKKYKTVNGMEYLIAKRKYK
jgi:hypothetical protein